MLTPPPVCGIKMKHVHCNVLEREREINSLYFRKQRKKLLASQRVAIKTQLTDQSNKTISNIYTKKSDIYNRTKQQKSCTITRNITRNISMSICESESSEWIPPALIR